MEKITFDKYVLCGNKFVLVDECRQSGLSEPAKQHFSRFVTDHHYGIGCDNFLVLQPCTPAVLDEINTHHRYWTQPPDHHLADFIFRMFEPDGTEAFCCGNGLTCIAEHIHRRHEQDSACIMIEVPFETPKSVLIGTQPQDGDSWTNLGRPRKMPPDLVCCPDLQTVDEAIDKLPQLAIEFSSSELSSFDCGAFADQLCLEGYLVFTGEPHMVVFVDDHAVLPALAADHLVADRRVEFASLPEDPQNDPDYHLIKHIGLEINRTYRSYFPKGLNINFAQVQSDTSVIRYRCFERGLNRETLACGTGAVATAFVAQRLNRVSGAFVEMHPLLCRREKADARLFIKVIDNDYYLVGRPQHLFRGESNAGIADTIYPTPITVKPEDLYREQTFADAYLIPSQ